MSAARRDDSDLSISAHLASFELSLDSGSCSGLRANQLFEILLESL